MKTEHWTDALVTMGACRDAVTWAREYESLDLAWAACERGDWLLWLLGQQIRNVGDPVHRALVLTVCACARTVLPFCEGETRPLAAIETAERWARHEDGVTLANVRAASAAAYAAYAAAADATYITAVYAADAVYAAYAANAAYAAYAAAYAAYVASATSATRRGHLKVLADLVRGRHVCPTLTVEMPQ